MNKKIVIVSLRLPDGGCVVLHALYKYLKECGENVKMLYMSDFNYKSGRKFKFWLKNTCTFIKTGIKRIMKVKIPCDNYPIVDYKYKYTPFVGKNTIVIYPEIMFANPLHAKKVVRWLLFHNKQYKNESGKTIGYDKNDLFFTYRDVFNDPVLNPLCRTLYVTYFNLDLYKRKNYGKRNGNCYIVRKGCGRIDLPREFDGPVIDDMSEENKVRTFNECKYCISYDTQTTYSSIAAMCGCISIVIPEPGKSREDYRTEYDKEYGVSFGFDESSIAEAIKTAPKIFYQYNDYNKSSLKYVEDFLSVCDAYFNT